MSESRKEVSQKNHCELSGVGENMRSVLRTESVIFQITHSITCSLARHVISEER